MPIRARAKINLTLNVRPLSELPDQRAALTYHELTSVFHLIDLADEVTITPAVEFCLSCEGQGLERLPIQDNLAWKAADAFARVTGCELPAVHINIEKHIPVGAGLAGGSADAAAVLLLLAERALTPIGVLREIAAGLGADVAFFLADSAACLMGGAGNELLAILRPAAGIPVAVVWDASAPISTPQVYAAFDQQVAPLDLGKEAALVSALDLCADIEQLAPHLYNNLSEAAFSVSPAARRVFDFVHDAPQTRATALSGSGGAVFALCASQGEASALVRSARAAGFAAQSSELAGSTLADQIAHDQKEGR